MGEAYRARDSGQARDVALKILPPEVARDESLTSHIGQARP
jgi:hypothetical protein